MSEEELETLINTVELKKLSFDGYEFELEFVNGLSVTVGKGTEWEMAVWEIESSLEKENRRIEYEKRRADEREKVRQKQAEQNEILSKFSPEQQTEIYKLLKNKNQ